DLDREEGAVLPPGAQLPAGSHAPGSRRAVVALTQLRMPRPDLVGDEHLDGMTDELLARVAEELLALRVGELDDALLVHDHQAVRRELENAAKELLRLLQAALGPVALHGAPLQDVDGAREVSGLVGRPREGHDLRIVAAGNGLDGRLERPNGVDDPPERRVAQDSRVQHGDPDSQARDAP